MTSRSLRAAWIIMMIPNLVILIFGLSFVFVPAAMNSYGFESYTGLSWSSFVGTKTADLLLLTSGFMFGINVLVITVLSTAITLMSFRKGARWSWYALLVGWTIGMGANIYAVSIMGAMPLAIISAVMLGLVYVALGITARTILVKR